MMAKALALALLVATPALAGHPGENLNEVMAAKEAAFEPVAARAAPELKVGSGVELEELKGKIVALSFVPEECSAQCADQQDLIEHSLVALNAGPMRDMVEFVTIADKDVARSEVPDNWTHILAGDAQSSAKLAAAFAAASARPDTAPMIHLLDRDGRQVGIFHGSEFLPLNLVLYINGLTNAHPHPDPSVFERLFGWLK